MVIGQILLDVIGRHQPGTPQVLSLMTKDKTSASVYWKSDTRTNDKSSLNSKYEKDKEYFSVYEKNIFYFIDYWLRIYV